MIKSKILNILLLVGAVYLLSMCSNNNRNVYDDYNINYYIDTIDNHIILTTVCNSNNNLSISTLKLK